MMMMMNDCTYNLGFRKCKFILSGYTYSRKKSIYTWSQILLIVLCYLIFVYCLINISRLTLNTCRVIMKIQVWNNDDARPLKYLLEFSASFHLHSLLGLHYAAIPQTLKLEKTTLAVLFQWFQYRFGRSCIWSLAPLASHWLARAGIVPTASAPLGRHNSYIYQANVINFQSPGFLSWQPSEALVVIFDIL